MRRKRATCDSVQTKMQSSLDVLIANVTKIAVARMLVLNPNLVQILFLNIQNLGMLWLTPEVEKKPL